MLELLFINQFIFFFSENIIPKGSVEKKAKLFGYGFGSIFLVIGIVCIMSLF